MTKGREMETYSFPKYAISWHVKYIMAWFVLYTCNYNGSRTQLQFLGHSSGQRPKKPSCMRLPLLLQWESPAFTVFGTRPSCECFPRWVANLWNTVVKYIASAKTFQDAYTKRSNVEASGDLDLSFRVMKYSLYVNPVWDASVPKIWSKSAQRSRRSSRTNIHTYRHTEELRVLEYRLS